MPTTVSLGQYLVIEQCACTLVSHCHMLTFVIAQDGDGMKAAISSDCVSIKTPPEKTAPVQKCFIFDRNDRQGKSSKALGKLRGKSIAHAEGTTNLKNHLYIWHRNEYNDLFTSPKSPPKEQPVLTEFMRPPHVEELHRCKLQSC